MRQLLLLLLLTITTPLPAADPTTWGHVRGQILVDGKARLPPLIEAGAPIFARQSLLDNKLGIPPKLIGIQKNDVPNLSLIVDEKTGGLKNVFVYLQKAPAEIHPSLKDIPATPVEYKRPTIFDTLPHAFFLRAGQPLQLFCTAEEPCDFHTSPTRNTPNNIVLQAQAQGPKLTWNSPERFPFEIKDDFHPTVRSYCLVLEHPYAAVSSTDGSFEIKNLPAGQHSLTLWHEKKGYLNKNLPLEIRPHETTTLPPIHLQAQKLLEEPKPN